MQPESILRDDAITLLRELRLDHSRYIQDVPDDWLDQVQKILKDNKSNKSFKIMAMLDRLKSSVIKTRTKNYHPSVNEDGKWRELIALVNRDNPFDLQVDRNDIIYNGDSTDLDGYLDNSEKELGAVNRSFKATRDWYEIINPLIMSDNSLAIVDRYFDLGSEYYSKLFAEFVQWLLKSKVAFVRIFIGPKSMDDIRNNYWKSEYFKFCDQALNILKQHSPQLRSNIVVSSCQDLHLRYFGSKVCALELDYGFRLSGSKNYKVSVMRASALNDFKSQFFSQIIGPNYLATKNIWPIKN